MLRSHATLHSYADLNDITLIVVRACPSLFVGRCCDGLRDLGVGGGLDLDTLRDAGDGWRPDDHLVSLHASHDVSHAHTHRNDQPQC
jgi:hypothetical protein